MPMDLDVNHSYYRRSLGSFPEKDRDLISSGASVNLGKEMPGGTWVSKLEVVCARTQENEDEHLQSISALLDAGADVDGSDEAGTFTPLMVAVDSLWVELVQLLMVNGADTRRLFKGQTAFAQLISRGSPCHGRAQAIANILSPQFHMLSECNQDSNAAAMTAHSTTFWGYGRSRSSRSRYYFYLIHDQFENEYGDYYRVYHCHRTDLCRYEYDGYERADVYREDGTWRAWNFDVMDYDTDTEIGVQVVQKCKKHSSKSRAHKGKKTQKLFSRCQL